MMQGRSWCKSAVHKQVAIITFITLIFLVVGTCLLFKPAAGIRWAKQATSQSVAYAETLSRRTQTFRLIPDNAPLLAAQHFQQAQAALATDDLAQAQIELEKALSLAELSVSRSASATNLEKHLPLLRQSYQAYVDVLLRRHQLQPEEGFASRAWEAHDRLRWLLSNQTKNTVQAVSRMLTVTEVQQQLLDEQSLLLEYALGDERSYLWAITKYGFACFTLPGRTTLEPKAERLHALVSMQPEQAVDDPNTEFVSLARELSEALLSPVAAQMERHRLIVVAEGILQHVPFGALPVPNPVSNMANGKRRATRITETSLLAQHEIIKLPAAATGVWLRQQHPQPVSPSQKSETFAGSVAIIADPVFGKYDERIRVQHAPAVETPTPAISRLGGLDGMLTRLRHLDLGQIFGAPTEAQARLLTRLPAARSEAEAIAEVAPQSTQWLDFEANRTLALSGKLSQFPILHFATHGVLDPENPANTGLLLSQVNEHGESVNGMLLNQEIRQMKLAAEMVVLSACESGVEEADLARESNSVAHSFLQAGAHRVVASLWKVNDAATAELMKRFYQKLFAGSAVRPAEALRAAQVEMSQTEHWRQPFYWAGFVLEGEN